MKRPPTLAYLVVIGLALLLAILAIFPDLDLMLAGRLYRLEGGSFAARFAAPLIALRDFGYYLPMAVLALAGLGWLYGKRHATAAKIFTGRRLLFLALSLGLGPGLIVNAVLKEVSHRPRPAQVEEFGGPAAFRPWYAFDGTCAKNCSFASGEVAGATWLVAPASLVPPPWQSLALAASTLVAVGVAALRLAFGGHFASDAVAAALISLLCILAVGRAIRGRRGIH